jgi:hypothetical protein
MMWTAPVPFAFMFLCAIAAGFGIYLIVAGHGAEVMLGILVAVPSGLIAWHLVRWVLPFLLAVALFILMVVFLAKLFT